MENSIIISSERIISKIYIIRNRKIMIDRDIAELYGVPTRALNQAVKRNIKRFPADFMFQIDKKEMKNWKSQIVTSNSEKMGLRKQPLAFTEHGILMLSSVLHSQRAIQVNIAIMRAFVKLREVLATHKELAQKFKELEHRVGRHDEEIQAIFDAIRQLMSPPQKPKGKIGFYKE